MTKFIAISEANSIALHGVALIAKSKTAINADDISEIIGASKHHASKVFQKLVKNDILSSTRGPSGGFYLNRSADKIKLIEIFEAIDGKITLSNCPLGNSICPFGNCLMGGVCHEVSVILFNYLNSHTIQDMINNIPSNKNIFAKREKSL
ncbi:Rrf2 family transcriptional regulator [Bacteroidales bacterium OttesenSCG-928-I21]|nr:Rrf2 family transcriptional regulator [Bacteroidales bacterium OttesenSCG-928-I21]